MVGEFLSTINAHTTVQIEFLYLAAVTIAGVFVFWRSVRRTMTRESEKEGESLVDISSLWGHRVFDLLLISGIISVLTSRLTYLLAHPDELRGVRWFWLPYERIEGTVFLFDSLPWLLLKVWEGGVLLDGLVLGWLVSLMVVSRLMKVKWGSISNALSDFFWVWFIGVELYAAVIWEIPNLLWIVCALLLLGVVRFRTLRAKERNKVSKRVHRSVSLTWKVATLVGVPIGLLINNVFVQEIAYEQVAVVLNIIAAIVGLWIISGDVLEFFAIITGSDVKPMESTVGIRGPAEIGRAYSGSAGGWRQYAEVRRSGRGVRSGVVAEGRRDEETARSFARSYKDFAGKWKNAVVVLFNRLTKRRTSGGSEGGYETAG